jgi:nicotinate-nucleotide pyrophosphorylase (carboxylating)
LSAPTSVAEWPSDATLTPLVETALAEDVGGGDVTTALTVPPGLAGAGRIIARSPCVVAGVSIVAFTYRVLSERFGAPAVTVRELIADGEPAGRGSRIVELEGSYSALLTGERVALNLLGHLTGVATLTAHYVAMIAGTKAVIVDTRKTLPGLRSLQKYAVRQGGGTNHRRGLDDAILVKENHVAAAGGIEAAVRRVTGTSHGLAVMIEVRTLEEAETAVRAGARTLLLDNMSPDEVRETSRRARALAGEEDLVLEVSGGLTPDRVRAFASAGIDRLSIGALTHSAPAADLSMLIERRS